MIAEIFSDDVPLTWKQRSEVEYVAERFGCTRTLQTVPREALRGIIAWTRGKIQCVFHAFLCNSIWQESSFDDFEGPACLDSLKGTNPYE